jgi:hypothetical protein
VVPGQGSGSHEATGIHLAFRQQRSRMAANCTRDQVGRSDAAQYKSARPCLLSGKG